MISKPLPNFKTQCSQKEEVGIYDNIALNQLYEVRFSCFLNYFIIQVTPWNNIYCRLILKKIVSSQKALSLIGLLRIWSLNWPNGEIKLPNSKLCKDSLRDLLTWIQLCKPI